MALRNPIAGNTNDIFITFEPKTLPITKSVFVLLIAAIVAASSGKLVPIATITRPTFFVEMLNSNAIFRAAETTYSAPNNINTKENIQ